MHVRDESFRRFVCFNSMIDVLLVGALMFLHQFALKQKPKWQNFKIKEQFLTASWWSLPHNNVIHLEPFYSSLCRTHPHFISPVWWHWMRFHTNGDLVTSVQPKALSFYPLTDLPLTIGTTHLSYLSKNARNADISAILK